MAVKDLAATLRRLGRDTEADKLMAAPVWVGFFPPWNPVATDGGCREVAALTRALTVSFARFHWAFGSWFCSVQGCCAADRWCEVAALQWGCGSCPSPPCSTDTLCSTGAAQLRSFLGDGLFCSLPGSEPSAGPWRSRGTSAWQSRWSFQPRISTIECRKSSARNPKSGGRCKTFHAAPLVLQPFAPPGCREPPKVHKKGFPVRWKPGQIPSETTCGASVPSSPWTNGIKRRGPGRDPLQRPLVLASFVL